MFKIDIQKQLYGANGKMDLDINFNINQGDFIILTGKSGSGKTTFLRILAGLENAKGQIKANNEFWLNNNINLAPQKRNIGFVFQDYALFSNMSVIDNLLFVKKDKKLANKLLEITELSSLQNRVPNTLSGGQKQRVSLCRAMMNNPQLLLLDEPFSALDYNMRIKLQDEILALHKEFNTTTILVSHNPSEIYKLASKIIILEYGKIIQENSIKNMCLDNDFTFESELLDIIKIQTDYYAVILINNKLIKIKITKDKKELLQIGEQIKINTKNLTIY